MRNYFQILFFFIISCNSKFNDGYYPGFKFSNFYGTDYESLANAVKNDNVKDLKHIIKKNNLDVNFKDYRYNMSLLCLAIVNKKKKSFIELLKLGADVNQVCGSKNNLTPLIISLQFNEDCDSFFIKNLLKYKADVNLSIVYSENGIKKVNSPLFQLPYKTDKNGEYCNKFTNIFSEANIDFNYTFYDQTIDLETNIIYHCLLNKNVFMLEDLILNNRVEIPMVVDVIGFGEKRKELSLEEVLKSDDFLSEGYPKDKKAVLNILKFLEK